MHNSDKLAAKSTTKKFISTLRAFFNGRYSVSGQYCLRAYFIPVWEQFVTADGQQDIGYMTFMLLA